jgi:hypothetical protein
MAVGARVDGPQRLTGWWRLGAAGAAGAHRSSTLHGYRALFSVVSLLTEPVECEELTKEVIYQWGAVEQDLWQQGSSLNLQRWWGNAPRVGSRQGWAKWVWRGT